MTTSAQATRPDLAYFVPDVRIVGLGEPRDKGERGTELEEDRPHITGVEVTRANSGVSQYSITLNNWNNALSAQAGGEAQFPPYRYNSLDRFQFGQRLRIDMCYRRGPSAGATESAENRPPWVAMIAGPITDMRFSFPAGEGATLTLVGEDDLCLLKAKNYEDSTPEKTEQEIIEEVLRLAIYPLPLQTSNRWREGIGDFFSDQSSRRSFELREGQSFLEFLESLAKSFDCEIYVDFDEAASVAPKVELHFEPARSMLPPNENSGDLYVLERGRNLIDFAPTFKVLDQYTGVIVRGRHRARGRAQQVRTPTVGPSILNNELYPSDSLTSGPEVRNEYFYSSFWENNYTLSRQTNLDDERAMAMAKAVLRQKAREFMTITATAVGMPHLRPGIHVEIRGMREPFDGFYYVERTVARFGSGGFTTQFTARRPGMPLPPDTEHQRD